MTTAPAAAGKNPAGIVRRPPFNHADPRAIVRRDGWNMRFDFGEIEALARSIKANDVLMPLRVKRLAVGDPRLAAGAVFELLDGDRRLTAIDMLLKEGEPFANGVPVIIVDKEQDDLTSLVQMFEANSGKPFLPMEKAIAFKRMKEGGLTLKQIEERTGCSDNDIVGCLALLDADGSVQEAVKSGSVSGGTAKAIAVNARGDKKRQAELIEQAKAAGKDKTKTKALRKDIDDERRKKAAGRGQKLKMRALDDAELSALGAACASRLKSMLEAKGMDFDADLREWMSGDDELKLAFTFGALEALKAAAGVATVLKV